MSKPEQVAPSETPLTDAERDKYFHEEPLRSDWITVSEATAHELLQHARSLERSNRELREALLDALRHAPELRELVEGACDVVPDSAVAHIRAALEPQKAGR